MQFSLVDRIVVLEPGHIEAETTFASGDEYLHDHFPGFPVIPGVLLLEALTQTGAWLIRATDDFSHSMVTLRRAVNARFGRFVRPDQPITLVADVLDRNGRRTRLQARGLVDRHVAVRVTLTLESYSLSEADPRRAAADQRVREHLEEVFSRLWRPSMERRRLDAPAALGEGELVGSPGGWNGRRPVRHPK